MSTNKSILIIFDKLIPLSQVEKDLKNIAKSGIFGLRESYSILEDEASWVHGGFIFLNNQEYYFDFNYFPNVDHRTAQLVIFTTDQFDFDDSLFLQDGTYQNDSTNIRALVGLLKNKLPYYLMTLYLEDHDTHCPEEREIFEKYLLGNLEDKKDNYCFEILDSPKFPLI